jgi:hypothetical protein
MVKEVRSPWSSERGDPDPHGMRGSSPGSRSSPSNAARADSGHLTRADSGHLNRHAGKGWTPISRRDSTPVQGAPYRDPTDSRR